MKHAWIGAGALALAACTTVPADSEPAGDICMAEGAEHFVGQRASSETGAAILAATHAAALRWAPPDSAMTMDFLESRVTVSYDRDYAITRVNCG